MLCLIRLCRYAALGLSPCRVVFDAERYIERVRPMPIDGGTFDFRFQTTFVTRKRDGDALINE